MASFRDTFDRPGTSVQAIDGHRATGMIMKVGALGLGTLLAASAATMAMPAVAFTATLAAATYGIGAALSANSTDVKTNGQSHGFVRKLAARLNPLVS